ncbi:MAG: hypothetical protein K8H86_01435 [Ignavibacteriaceae bacterium]|nr:hypothetical protein [Ignavibacteriaceae bacterium]
MLNDVLSSVGFKVEIIIFINNADGCVISKKGFHILKSNYAALHFIPHSAEYSPLEGFLKLTTMIYTHVLNRGIGVRSPLD